MSRTLLAPRIAAALVAARILSVISWTPPARWACLLLLSACTALAGSALTITFDDSFDPESRINFQALANEVADIVVALFGQGPSPQLPIVCYWRPDYPQTSLDDWQHPTRIEIGLAVQGGRFGQFVYQFSHELGHVMFGPWRTNGHIEALCESLSYTVLERMAGRWAADRSSPLKSLLWPVFHHYSVERQASVLARFPAEVRRMVTEHRWAELHGYLRQHQQDLEQLTQEDITLPEGRDWQALAASALVASPVDWPQLRDLEQCTEPAAADYPDLLVAPWDEAKLAARGDVLCRLGLGCGDAAAHDPTRLFRTLGLVPEEVTLAGWNE